MLIKFKIFICSNNLKEIFAYYIESFLKMQYSLNCVVPKTYNIGTIKLYEDYRSASGNIKSDIELYIQENKSVTPAYIESVSSLKSDSSLSSGLYLKKSQKYANRFCLYEKFTIENSGYIYNTYDIQIQKIMIFTIVDIIKSCEHVDLKSLGNVNVNKTEIPKLDYLQELSKVLLKRRESIDASSSNE